MYCISFLQVAAWHTALHAGWQAGSSNTCKAGAARPRNAGKQAAGCGNVRTLCQQLLGCSSKMHMQHTRRVWLMLAPWHYNSGFSESNNLFECVNNSATSKGKLYWCTTPCRIV